MSYLAKEFNASINALILKILKSYFI